MTEEGGGVSKFTGLLRLKHITAPPPLLPPQPPGSDNPRLERYTTSVTLAGALTDSHAPRSGGSVASGGLAGQTARSFERYFGCRVT